jgi:Nucleotidyl transferase AbiEii toxin, Type IV TA system
MSQPQYLAASVRQRLLNLAQSQQENFNLVLTRYGIERLLYRLTQSPSGDRFILKGAMLFTIWSNTPHRMTKDIDLLSRGDNSIENIETIFREICRLEVVPDGLTFDETTVKGTLIKADREYLGVRILSMAGISISQHFITRNALVCLSSLVRSQHLVPKLPNSFNQIDR